MGYHDLYVCFANHSTKEKQQTAAKTTTATTTATVTVQVRQAEVSQWEFSCHYVFPDEIVKRITSTNTFRK